MIEGKIRELEKKGLLPRGIDGMEFLELWKANEEILKQIEVSISSHFSEDREISCQDNWEEILFKGFFIALNRMKAIQLLLKPNHSHNFFMESASLTRNLWEIWLSLAWLNHENITERDNRIEKFKSSSIMDQNELIQTYNQLAPNQVQSDDLWFQEEAKKIERQFPNKSWKVPNNSKIMEDITLRDERYKDTYLLYYRIVYKDFSHYVHCTWRTITEIDCSIYKKEIGVFPHEDLGTKCLEISWGFFMFITEIWNDLFKVIPDKNLEIWFKDRLEIQSKSISPSGKNEPSLSEG